MLLQYVKLWALFFLQFRMGCLWETVLNLKGFCDYKSVEKHCCRWQRTVTKTASIFLVGWWILLFMVQLYILQQSIDINFCLINCYLNNYFLYISSCSHTFIEILSLFSHYLKCINVRMFGERKMVPKWPKHLNIFLQLILLYVWNSKITFKWLLEKWNIFLCEFPSLFRFGCKPGSAGLSNFENLAAFPCDFNQQQIPSYLTVSIMILGIPESSLFSNESNQKRTSMKSIYWLVGGCYVCNWCFTWWTMIWLSQVPAQRVRHWSGHGPLTFWLAARSKCNTHKIADYLWHLGEPWGLG